ncbi:MAG: Glycerophosphoryl diester phosphodiesterase, partial [Actinomycetia bacterium]|nr:Glycerophosphoryl diester phosphodiesterase [Actinomycetes bacterium]
MLAVAVLVAATACSSSGKPSVAPAPISATTTTTRPAAVLGPLRKASEQAISPVYAQGVAHIPNGWIFSGTNSLWRTDNALKEVVSANPAIPAAWTARGFNHIGDIDVIGKYIYAPLEQPDYTKGQQATARFDRDTLRFVDAVTLPQHENSFVTIEPTTMTAYTMDHFDGNTILRYDVAHGWKRLAPLRLSTTLHHTQGADILNGVIWISTSDARNDLYGVDLSTGKVRSNGSMGHTGGQGEGEGLDATAL